MSNNIRFVKPIFYVEVSEANEEREIKEILISSEIINTPKTVIVGTNGGNFLYKINKPDYEVIFLYIAKGSYDANGNLALVAEFYIELVSKYANIVYKVDSFIDARRVKVLTELFDILEPKEFSTFAKIIS